MHSWPTFTDTYPMFTVDNPSRTVLEWFYSEKNMNTHLKTIMQAEERRAEKVQDLNALLQDPDLADYVSKLLGEKPVPHSVAAQIAPTNGNGHALRNLTLTPAIRFIAQSLPSKFTVTDIAKQMQDGGFNFGKRKPEIAVRDSMYFLCRGESPIFRVAVAGKAGKPNIYERI